MTVQPDTNTRELAAEVAAGILNIKGSGDKAIAALEALVARCEEAEKERDEVEREYLSMARLAAKKAARAERAERLLRDFIDAIERHADPSSVSGRKLIPSMRLRGVMEETRFVLDPSAPEPSPSAADLAAGSQPDRNTGAAASGPDTPEDA